MKQLTLDEQLSERLKNEGLASIGVTAREFVTLMRAEAIRLYNSRGWVTSDDLRVYASQRDIEPPHQNSWGAIFRGPSWTIVGRRKSAVPDNHHREIKIWKYEPKGGE